MKSVAYSLIAAAWMAVVTGCGQPAETKAGAPAASEPASPARVSFAADVQPILKQYCERCHLGGNRKGGFSLDARESALEAGKNGPRVVPGNSAGSDLFLRVSQAAGHKPMPPKEPRLTPNEVEVLRAWIDQGLAY